MSGLALPRLLSALFLCIRPDPSRWIEQAVSGDGATAVLPRSVALVMLEKLEKLHRWYDRLWDDRTWGTGSYRYSGALTGCFHGVLAFPVSRVTGSVNYLPATGGFQDILKILLRGYCQNCTRPEAVIPLCTVADRIFTMLSHQAPRGRSRIPRDGPATSAAPWASMLAAHLTCALRCLVSSTQGQVNRW